MRRPRLFPEMIFGLIGVNMVIVAVTVAAATRDRSFAVEPDYDVKALRWDEQRAAAERSRALGWSATLTAERTAPEAGYLAVTLTARDGTPIEGAVVDLDMFHSARAAHHTRLRLSPGAPGVYGAPAPLDRHGLWEIELTARCGADHFAARLGFELVPASPATPLPAAAPGGAR